MKTLFAALVASAFSIGAFAQTTPMKAASAPMAAPMAPKAAPMAAPMASGATAKPMAKHKMKKVHKAASAPA